MWRKSDGVVTKRENSGRMLTGRRGDRAGTVEEDAGGWRWSCRDIRGRG